MVQPNANNVFPVCDWLSKIRGPLAALHELGVFSFRFTLLFFSTGLSDVVADTYMRFRWIWVVGVPFWSTLRLKCPPTFVLFVDRTDVKPSLLTKDNELPRYMKQDDEIQVQALQCPSPVTGRSSVHLQCNAIGNPPPNVTCMDMGRSMRCH